VAGAVIVKGKERHGDILPRQGQALLSVPTAHYSEVTGESTAAGRPHFTAIRRGAGGEHCSKRL